MQLKHLNDMWIAFWEALGVPITIIFMAMFFVGIILGPVLYIDAKEEKKPISRRKCQAIHDTLDPNVRWSNSLNMCSVPILDDKETIIGFKSYTTVNGKIIRQDVML